MPSIVIAGFAYDDDNENKIAGHGLDVEDLDDVLDARFVVVRNRRARRAPYLVIGRNRAGRCIAIPIEPTTGTGIWRPVTAWPCKPSERARLPR